jgi:hypothetical protein
MMGRVVLPAFPVAGGCQCGAVRYELLAPPRGVYACHCKDCQRFSGAGYSMSMVVWKGDLRVTKGEPDGYSKTAESGRIAIMHGCANCHTRLWNEPLSAPDVLIVKPGTLDDTSWAVPAGHIWAGRKLPWVEIDPDALAFEGQPASRDPLYEAWDKMVVRGT